MPIYDVTAPGFWGGVHRTPNGKNNTVVTAKPIPKDKVPAWLKPASKAKSAKAESAKIDNPPSFVDDDDDNKGGLETL